MNQQGLESYIRRVINIEDVLPAYPNLSLTHVRAIVDFLDKQENASKVTPPLYYKLVEKIINDAKVSGKADKMSSSKNIEKNRIDNMIQRLFDKIPRESAIITEPFVDTLVLCATNLPEIPNYFLRTIKIAISNVVPKTIPEGAEGEAA